MSQESDYSSFFDQDGPRAETELEVSAYREKVISAERRTSSVRAIVITVNSLVYLLMERFGYYQAELVDTSPILAYSVIVLALLYGLSVFAFKPYEKYPIMLASYFTYISDIIFITLWLYATGGYDSPFYILWYLSIVAVAFRFNYKVVLASALLYAISYIGLMLVLSHVHTPHQYVELALRCSYIIIIGHLASLITRETYEQTREKLYMRQLTDSMRRTQLELNEKSAELRELNTALEEKVTERTKELRASAKTFSELLNSIPLLAWTTTPEGKVTYRNARWMQFFKRDMDGTALEDYVFPADVPRALEMWKSIKDSGDPMEIEYRWKRHDGVWIWLLARIIAIRNKEGQITMWVGTATDINEQKVLQEQKDQFIGMASHEMKTPLTSIKAYAQLVERSLESNEIPQAKTFIQKTGLFINRLERLIADLLDVSKIQSGKLIYSMQEFEFNAFAQEVAESLQQISKTHTIELIPGSKVYVNADKQRMEQVLNNLVSNAVKYAPDAPMITIKVEAAEDQVYVSVTDKGIGIPQEKLRYIFDRFYRVNENPTVSGLGIGLFITKEIITRHKGHIWVESTPGAGTTFHFTLPVAHTGKPEN